MNEKELAAYRDAIGRELVERQWLDRESLRRFTAALGEDPDALPAVVPPMCHWAFFLPTVARARIGPDGHPLRGDFLPAVSLPRRMFAGAETEFLAPLVLGQEAERHSRIADVKHRAGKAGDLVFVEVAIEIRQGGATCLRERQSIVYRDAGGATPAVQPAPVAAQGETWTPGPVDLFRFSAVTFNSHRIHYDQRYAREEEGYPDLVVHGPFTALKLCGLAARAGALRGFAFRAQAPLFVGQPVVLVDKAGAGERSLEAVRCDGAIAMAATARH